VLDFIRSLGLEPNDVRDLHLTGRHMEVTFLLRNESGERFVAGDEVASLTVRVPVTDRQVVKAEDAA